MDKDSLRPMAKHYEITEDLSAELHTGKRLIERKRNDGMVVNTTHDLLELLKPEQETYVGRLKTYLRNKSGDTRTSNLGVLSISSVRTKELEVNAVLL